MSASLCSTTHTLAIALAVHAIDGTPVRQTALILRALNNAAMASRFGDKPARLYCSETAIGAAMRWVERATPADVAKLAECMHEQCRALPDAHERPQWPVLVHCVTLLSGAVPAGQSSTVWEI